MIRLRKITAMNSLNLYFLGQELKTSYSNKSFLLPNNMFKKNWKKLTTKIYIIVCALTETKDHINPFQVDLSSPHHQFFDFFFSIWVSFHEHSRITELQGRGGGGISLTPRYHFHPLHRHLHISWVITAESLPLHIASSRTRTGNLWFPSASR